MTTLFHLMQGKFCNGKSKKIFSHKLFASSVVDPSLFSRNPTPAKLAAQLYRHLMGKCFISSLMNYHLYIKGTCQKHFSGFCPLRGYPPPTPLTENHFAKIPFAERGGTPPPLNGQSLCSKKLCGRKQLFSAKKRKF